MPIAACWLHGYTWCENGDQQHKDNELKLIFGWLERQEVPSENELFLSSPATKHYWINKELFHLGKDGVLWKRNTENFATNR
jgi:hypothetical protein